MAHTNGLRSIVMEREVMGQLRGPSLISISAIVNKGNHITGRSTWYHAQTSLLSKAVWKMLHQYKKMLPLQWPLRGLLLRAVRAREQSRQQLNYRKPPSRCFPGRLSEPLAKPSKID